MKRRTRIFIKMLDDEKLWKEVEEITALRERLNLAEEKLSKRMQSIGTASKKKPVTRTTLLPTHSKKGRK